MKKILILTAVVLIIFSLPVFAEEAAGFVHPGILATEADLDRAAEKVSAGESPWKESYDNLMRTDYVNAGWNPRPLTDILRGGAGQNYAQFYIDLERAYQCALVWRVTGSEAHGAEAVKILNAWSGSINSVGGNADRYLASGIYGYQMAAASELVREREDFELERMKNVLLEKFYYPLCERFLFSNEYGRDHNDAFISSYWANWDLCNMAATVAIGIFCDDRDIYDKGIWYFKYGGGCGSIYNAVPYLFEDENGEILGQWQESGRDQGHTQLGIGLMASVCEMAWNQGDDLYSWADNRFMYAAEYFAKQHIGQEVPYFQYTRMTGPEWRNREEHPYLSGATGERRPIWAMIYNHYVGRMGKEMPYVKALMEQMGPEGGPYPGAHAAQHDQPGFGTLLYTREKADNDAVMTTDNVIEDGKYVFTLSYGHALGISGDRVIQANYDADDNSIIWEVSHLGGEQYSIKNLESGKYLQANGLGDGTRLTLGDWADSLSQKFAILPSEIDGMYKIVPLTASHKALDVLNPGVGIGAEVQLYPYIRADNQRWRVTKVDEGNLPQIVSLIHHYTFSSEDSDEQKGTVLDVATGERLQAGEGAAVYNNKLLLNGGSLRLQEDIFNEGQTEFTIAAFMNSTAYGWWRGLFAIGDDDLTHYLSYIVDTGGSTSQVEYQNLEKNVPKTYANGAYAVLGAWKHVAVVFRDEGETRKIILYENGREVNSMNTALTLDDLKGKNNFIGQTHYVDSSDNTHSFYGFVDDFRIYDGDIGPNRIYNLSQARPDEDRNFQCVITGPELAGASGDEAVKDGELYMYYDVDFGELAPLSSSFIISAWHMEDYSWINDSETALSQGQLHDGKAAIGILPADSNRVYGIQVWGKGSDGDYADRLGYANADGASLYALLLEDIDASGYNADFEKNQARVDSANKIIAAGGFYTGEIDGDLRGKLMTVTRDGVVITAVIKPSFYAFGIGFICDKDGITVGGDDTVNDEGETIPGSYQAVGEAGVLYSTLVINTEERTAILLGPDGEEEVVVSLENIESPLVRELMEKSDIETYPEPQTAAE